MDRTARGVLDVARSVLAELDLEIVLNRVLESARELTGARYAALGVLGSSRTELERFLTLGIDESEREAIGALPRGRGVLGELIQHPDPPAPERHLRTSALLRLPPRSPADETASWGCRS